MKVFMIVDDSPVIRKVARRIIEGMGYVVAEAEDGIDGLEKCDHAMPDAVMVDWDMPRMGGVEFIEQLKSRPAAAQTKVLFCTSEVNMPEMMKAKRAGADGYVIKPFTRAILQQSFSENGIEQPVAA